ncbi:MAG: hypothetical protein U0Z17_03845 [Bacteroidales bacterium]
MYYIAFWVAVVAIQFALQYGVYDQDLTVATADCLVSNFIFALLERPVVYDPGFGANRLAALCGMLFIILPGALLLS